MPTKTGKYSHDNFGDRDSGAPGHAKVGSTSGREKFRNAAIGPALQKSAYATKSFAHIDEPTGVGSGPVPRNAGKVVTRVGSGSTQGGAGLNSGRQDVSVDLSDKYLGKPRGAKRWE